MEKEKLREIKKAGKENGGYKISKKEIKLRSREAIKGRQMMEYTLKPAP